MKKLLSLAFLLALALTAFAQGKVRFVNDSLHLVYFASDPSLLLPADGGLAGQAVPVNGSLPPSGVTLVAELWAGTNSSMLQYITASSFVTNTSLPGTWYSRNIILPFAAGAGQFFQVLVYDGNAGSYGAASTGQGYYYGQSPIFTCNSGASITYNSIVNPNSPSYSTWAAGDYALDSVLAGAKGAIMLQAYVPCDYSPSFWLSPVQNQTVAFGQTVTFSTAAYSGVSQQRIPVHYQWSFNGTNIPSATGKIYTFSNALLASAGTYSVTATNCAGATATASATLEVVPFFITSQPQSQRIHSGQTASFSVGVSGVSLGYQWLFDGAELASATGSTYTLTNAQLADAGTYSVRVTNPAGTNTSQPALLQVLPFGAPDITVDGQAVIGSVTLVGAAEIEIAGGFTNGFIFYTLDGTVPTTSSPLYVGPIVITNSATIQAMSLSADFSQSAYALPIQVQIIPVYNLQTAVVGGGTITTSPGSNPYASNSIVVLTATGSPGWSFDHWTGDLSGTQNPASLTMDGPRSVQAVFAQTAYPLTVTTPGGGTVTVNGQVIQPRTFYPIGSQVTLAANAGSGWSFLRWQGDASGTDNPLSLTVTQTNNVQAIFGTMVGTNILGPGNIVLSPANPVPYGTLLTATAVAAPGNYFKLWSGAASGTNSPTRISITSPTPTVGALFAAAPAGEWTLNVVVNGNGTVSVTPQKPYYDPGGVVTLSATTTNGGTSFSGWSGDAQGTANPLTLVMNTNLVVVANFGSLPSVSISPQNLSVLAGSTATLNAEAVGLPPLTYQWFHGSETLAAATNAVYGISNAQSSDAGGYWVVVSNPYGSATSGVSTVTVVFPPSITQQPSGGAVAAGTALTLTAVAAGTGPLSYQWVNSGGFIPGATGSSYTIAPTLTNSADGYFIIVTNLYGAVTSSVATVMVYVPVSIAAQPASLVVPAHATAVFDVGADGYPAPSYQWRLWGTNLPGATLSSLTVANVGLGDLGDYAVFVNNGYSSLLSDPATLNMSPSITSPFLGATAIWGRNANLSVSAIGTGTLSYQWYKDGALIASGTNASLDLPSVQLGDAGFYSVVVSSDLGSVTNSAQLVVNPAGIDLGLYAGMTITGVVGYTYEIQYTMDLAVTNSWSTLTNLTLEQPVEIWVDTTTNAAATRQRFYRILPGQ